MITVHFVRHKAKIMRKSSSYLRFIKFYFKMKTTLNLK